MPNKASGFFVVGGTLGRQAASYVSRPADEELLRLSLAGEYCNVLAARQTGKSSLMVRTAERLKREGVRTVIIDLTSIGSNISPSEWYFGLISRLSHGLDLSLDEQIWWQAHSEKSPVQRFSDFLREVVLEEIKEPIVVFVDEIDSTLKIRFTDDFFAAIRASYNARSNDPAYQRLTFVLLGVARPADLIKDRTRTPYNIGISIDVTDFQINELTNFQIELEKHLPNFGQLIVHWALEWTGGQPYLTQKLCAEIVQQASGEFTQEKLGELVGSLFLGDKARTETNLRSIRDRINGNPYAARMLRIYKQVLAGKHVIAQEQSIEQNELKLTGLVKVSPQGFLQVRNRIYASIFDVAWAKENSPVSTAQRWSIAVSIIAIIAISIAGYLFYQQRNQAAEVQAAIYIENFNSQSAEIRITGLAGLFELGGEYAVQAAELFNWLGHEEQMALFDLVEPGNVGDALLIVVENTYQNQRNTVDGNELLQAMSTILERSSVPGSIGLVIEINAWLDGRDQASQGNHSAAITFYTNAWEKSQERNQENAGVLFDRGISNAAVEQYELALKDFDDAIGIDETFKAEVTRIIIDEPALSDQLGEKNGQFLNLASIVSVPSPLPTVEPTPNFTPTPSPTAIPEGWLFYDDFEGYNILDGFDKEYQSTIPMNVRQLDDSHGKVLFLKPEFPGRIEFGEKWQNYAVEYDFMIIGKQSEGYFYIDLRKRTQNVDEIRYDSYQFFWQLQSGIFLQYILNGRSQNFFLTYNNRSLFSDRWYHIRAEAKDDLLRLYVDDDLLLQTKDSRISSGYTSLGFGDAPGIILYLDNILVESLE